MLAESNQSLSNFSKLNPLSPEEKAAVSHTVSRITPFNAAEFIKNRIKLSFQSKVV